MIIQKILIQNFKAFKIREVIDLEGKNTLICGNNGSGKSSLHYALHVFLQSSLKEDGYKKYFTDPKKSSESLLNIYGDPAEYLVELELQKQDGSKQKYQIKPTLDAGALPHTHQDIINADFASDFISHRLLVNFYNFRNSQDANLWTLFENEVFPYWNDTAKGKSFDKWIKELRTEAYDLSQVTETVPDESGDNQITTKKHNRDSAEFKALQLKISEFNVSLFKFYSVLLPEVKTILNEFLTGENIDVDIAYNSALDIDGNFLWNIPELILKIKANGFEIPKPHIFLSEAKLTALGLAVRLAMFNKKFKGTSTGDTLKLLMLDDLLVSLDMSFRMKLVKYIQQEQYKKDGAFKGYQIMMLTHDKGLFEILQQTLAEDESKWKCFEFFETNTYPINNPADYKNPLIVEKKDALVLAEEYLKGKQKNKEGKIVQIPKDNELAALYIRKKTEQLIKRFYDPEMDKIFRYRILKDLSNAIAGIKTEYINTAHTKIEDILSSGEMDEAKIQKLIDLKFDETGLGNPEKIANSKLLTFKKNVFTLIKFYYTAQHNFQEQKKELEALSKEMNLLRSRIMNKGAHHDDSPIFELELRGAMDKIKEFQTVLLKIHTK